MFHKGKVIAALEAKRSHFTDFDAVLASDLKRLGSALDQLGGLSKVELEARLAGIPWPGARPTAEFGSLEGIIVPFVQAWSSHEDARGWAIDILQDTTTFAVDGSQLPPSRDFSTPVAAVQIGWFENPHRTDQPYTKALDYEVLAPDELASGPSEGSGFPEWRLQLRRFQRETQALIERMQAAEHEAVKPVCLMDGSLVASFIQHLQPDRQQDYLDAILQLLETSEHTRVPLFAYIDTSYAADLAALLRTLDPGGTEARISDATLLRPRMSWGDRSQAFICARDDDVLVQYARHSQRICFAYLKTTRDGSPARVEFPKWMLEDSLLEHGLDVVRAECVVGIGYPYVIETADAVAVITSSDREQFYRTFQEFAGRAGLSLYFSRKALSKRRRRTR